MYTRQPFGMIPACDMLQRKIGELFQGLPNVIGIVDDILIAGSDQLGRNHNETVNKVLQICRKAT